MFIQMYSKWLIQGFGGESISLMMSDPFLSDIERLLIHLRLVISATSGIFIFPNPPSFLGVFIQARWVNSESTDAPITSAPIFRNSSTRSLNWYSSQFLGDDSPESNNFCWTNKSKIKWIKEEDNIFSLIIG